MAGPYFLGIDIGTQGARVVLLDVEGNVIGSCEENFPLNDQSREEQSTYMWWDACLRSLKGLLAQVNDRTVLKEIRAVSVTSTSGTVIPLDEQQVPLHDALMYSDKRSAEEGKLCREISLKFSNGGYTGFNASSGLSKMVWFVRKFPDKAKK